MLCSGVLLAQSSPATDALDALKGLRSVTEMGVSYRDFVQRALDAKVKVDRYLESPEKDDAALRAKVKLAMRLYGVGAQAYQVNNDVTETQIATAVGTAVEEAQMAKVPAIAAHLPEWQKQAAAKADEFMTKNLGVAPSSKPQEREYFRLAKLGTLASQDFWLYWNAAAETIKLAETQK